MFLFFGIVAVAGSYFVQVQHAAVGGVRAAPCRSGCWRARSSSSTTCATSRPTGARASARWRCGSGASARARCTRRCSRGAFVTAPLPWAFGSMSAVAAAAAGWRSRSRVRLVRIVRTRTDGPALNGALAETGALQLALLPAALRRHPRQRRHRLVKLDARSGARCASRAPLQTSYGDVRERELLRVSLTDERRRHRPRRGGAAASPTTASASSACARRSSATRRCSRDCGEPERRAAARRLPRAPTTCPQALAAVDLALWDRAGRRAGSRSPRC